MGRILPPSVPFQKTRPIRDILELPRKRVISEKPIFYCLDEDWNNNLLRSYHLKICEKRWSNRIHVCHEIFMPHLLSN
ncbi:hypothetical protein ACFX2G_033643 [Malus domestica]